MNIIRTRHLKGGRISQTINGKVVYRGRSWDFPVSPDCLPRSVIEKQLRSKNKLDD